MPLSSEEMKEKWKQTHCQKPDRDVSKLTCGYPLPCPFHTIIIDVPNETIEYPLGNGNAVKVPFKKGEK